jgi:hypothetical protein
MINAVIIAVLGALLAIQEFCHYRERKDLYNRLMAKDLADYNLIANSKNKPPPRSRNVIRAGLERYYNSMKSGD